MLKKKVACFHTFQDFESYSQHRFDLSATLAPTSSHFKSAAGPLYFALLFLRRLTFATSSEVFGRVSIGLVSRPHGPIAAGISTQVILSIAATQVGQVCSVYLTELVIRQTTLFGITKHSDNTLEY